MLHQAAFGAGLFGDEHVAEHGLGVVVDFVRGLAELDAALEAALESALAAAAGVDLRFDDEQCRAVGEQFLGDRLGGFGRVADVARRARRRRIGASSCLAWYS